MKQRIMSTLLLIIVAIAVLGLTYLAFSQLEHLFLAGVTAVLFWVLPLVVSLSYYFGKTEARGFLAGADRIMDSILGKSIDAYDKRQTSKAQAQPLPELSAVIYPPAPGIAEFRQASAKTSVFDYREDDE